MLPLLGLAAGAAGSGLMSAIGSLFGGDKPDVPPFVPVNVGTAQDEALTTNLNNMQDMAALASTTNRLSGEETLKQLERMAPGFSSMVAQQRKIVESQLRGEIPEDVARQITKYNAGKAVAGGVSNLPYSMGMTSYQIMQQGLNAADRWLGRAQSMAPTFDFSRMFVTPQMTLGAQQFNSQQQWDQQWLQNQINAMPSGADKFFGSFFNSMGGMGSNMLGGYMGASMYKSMFPGGAGAGGGGWQGEPITDYARYQGGWNG